MFPRLLGWEGMRTYHQTEGGKGAVIWLDRPSHHPPDSFCAINRPDTTRTGLPTAVAIAGISTRTTECAPMIVPSPIRALAPISIASGEEYAPSG